MKFEKAYSSYDDKTHTIENLHVIFSSNRRLFVEKYKDSLFCPECRKAQLSYHNASASYLQTYPGAKHKSDCILRQDDIGEATSGESSVKTETLQTIRRKMESLLNSFYKLEGKPSVSKDTNNSDAQDGESGFRNYASKNNVTPQKRIDQGLSCNDYFLEKIFYGPVHIKWERSKDYYKLLLFHREAPKMICRIYVTENVFRYIPKGWKAPIEYDCKIAFVGVAQPVSMDGNVIKNGEEFAAVKMANIKPYFQVRLVHSDRLLIYKDL